MDPKLSIYDMMTSNEAQLLSPPTYDLDQPIIGEISQQSSRFYTTFLLRFKSRYLKPFTITP